MCSSGVQLVQYDCDIVHVTHSDGSTLQLSPCAACFVYIRVQGDDYHSVHGDKVIQQRTPYTISTFRDKVQKALEFRNKFAARPYLCKEVLDPCSLRRLHADLVELQWPSDIKQSDIETLEDGSLQLKDVQQHASVTLASCQQLFTVRYLCKVGRIKQTKKLNAIMQLTGCTQHTPAISQKTSSKLPEPQQDDSLPSKATILTDGFWDYAWVTQQFSVLDIPECWQHPSHALIQFAKRNTNSVHFEDEAKSNQQDMDKSVTHEETRTYVKTLIPKALPLNCLSLHLHKWTTNDGQGMSGPGRLKVICAQDVIYRIINTSSVCVEIYPGDGSLMRSHGLAGHYFTHYIYKNGKIEEKIHSVLHPPPDTSGSLYSIAKLIRRGARLLQDACDQNLHLLRSSFPICWQVDAIEEPTKEVLSSIILEQCTVNGVGRFTAHSSGRIHILFEDRTSLDMITDWSSRVSQYQKRVQGSIEIMDLQSHPSSCWPDIPKDTCRLLLPNGHYQFVNISSPGQYQRYIQAALEWIAWVNTSPSERCMFYKDTIHDEDKLNSVEQELMKIRCFNYIIENTVMSQFSHAKERPADKSMVDGCDMYNINAAERMNVSRPRGTVLSRPLAAVAMATDLDNKVSSLARDATASLNGYAFDDTDQSDRKSRDLCTSGSDVNQVSYQFVQDVLRQTSQKIKELDSFLGKHGRNDSVNSNEH